MMFEANGGGIILLYHRVTTLSNDPQLLAVTPEHFAAHLDILRRTARPTALKDMAYAARSGEDLRSAVAISFDDGYADNFLQAKPLLSNAGIPATVFVATGGVDSRKEFFWDELDRIFLQPGRLPQNLSVQVGSTVYEADLGSAASYSIEQSAQFRDWNVTVLENPTPRQQTYRELCALIYQSTTEQRQNALEQLRQWSGMGCEGRHSHRMMTAAQLRGLVAGGLVEVGAHTVSHSLLAAEKPQDQRREIIQSKASLESIFGTAVETFSYPFGGRRDYTADSVAAVREAGYACACSNFSGMVDAGTDLFQLPRMLVRNWPADEFRARLTRWFECA